MIEDRFIYRPQWYQKEFHRSKARYRVLLGGRQSGKTLAGIMEALIQAQNNPGSTGLIIAPTYNMLWDNIIKDFLNIIMSVRTRDGKPVVKEWNQTRLDLFLTNGTEIRFRSADNPDRFRGTRPDWLWADEVRDMKSDVWDVIQPGMAVTNGIAWFTTTPNGRDWVYKRFVVPALDNNPNYWWKQFKTSDNPHANKEQIEIARQSMPEWFFRQEYEASIEDYVGLIYPDFKQSIHVVNEIPIQMDWVFLEGIDVGYTNPSAVLLAGEDHDGRLWIIDEIYKTKLLPQELVQEVRELENKYSLNDERIYSRVIDPASLQKPQAATDSVQAQLAEHDLLVQSCIKHEVKDGILRVSKYFKVDEKSNQPRIFIHSRCKNLIKEIEEYVWDESNKEDRNSKEKPRKYQDHAVDALRYMVMMRPDYAEFPKVDPYSGKIYYNGEDPDEEYLKRYDPYSEESEWSDVL